MFSGLHFPESVVNRMSMHKRIGSFTDLCLVGTEVSLSSFVIQACEFALDNLADAEHESTQDEKSQ